jgi:prepilin-type N-terminal cleavage/methylation domain-containing protein
VFSRVNNRGFVRGRAGFTLMEVMVAVTAAVVVAGIALALLDTLLKSQGSAREAIRGSTVVGRLAEQFRRDVHAAQKPGEAGPEKHVQRLEMPAGRMVEYKIVDGEAAEIDRVERVGEVVKARESYTLPAGSTAKIESREEGGRTMLGLVISSATQAVRIEAELAKDRRMVPRSLRERAGERGN